MNIDIVGLIKILAALPPGSIEDGLALVQEGVKLAADVKAFTDKYPEVLEAFKKLRG